MNTKRGFIPLLINTGITTKQIQDHSLRNIFAEVTNSLFVRDTFTIAYVEDDPMLRRLLGIYLNRQGFEVPLEAGSGKALLELLKGADSIPDVCLLDLNMPDMD